MKSKTQIVWVIMLILSLVMFPGMQSCDESGGDVDFGHTNMDSVNIASSAENKTLAEGVVLSPEKMQESTNKLVIYIHPFIEKLLTPALRSRIQPNFGKKLTKNSKKAVHKREVGVV